MKKVSEEKATQKLILEYLNNNKFYCWRNNTGMIFSEYKGKKRAWYAGMKGSSDIIGVAPNGKFIGIEVKGKGNKPSLSQQMFLAEVTKRGGYALVAYSLEDVVDFIEKNGL